MDVRDLCQKRKAIAQIQVKQPGNSPACERGVSCAVSYYVSCTQEAKRPCISVFEEDKPHDPTCNAMFSFAIVAFSGTYIHTWLYLFRVLE